MKISDIVFTLPGDARKTAAPSVNETELPTENKEKETIQAQGEAPFRSVEDRFMDLCRRHPDRIALSDERENLSFSRLDQLSSDIAGFIKERGIEPEDGVGVMCERSTLFVAAFLGIIRAGGVYVPLDPVLPLERREIILSDSRASLLITDKVHAGDARKLAYACPELASLLCLNAGQFEDAVESPGDLMSIELWNHVSKSASDGSWKSFFTGSPLSPAVLGSLALNLLDKAGFQLGPDRRVLDIGSGSGQVAKMLMANCREYTCIDLSRFELDRVEEVAGAFENLTARVHQMEAIDIHLLNIENLDLVVLNSVIENFPGYNYLGKVLDRGVEILGDDGLLFAGSVWDPDLRDLFLSDLETHGEKTDDFSGMIRLSQGEELFVPRTFFTEWSQKSPWELSIEFSAPKVDEAELNRYRYDVTIQKKGVKPVSPESIRYFGSHHLRAGANDREREQAAPAPAAVPGPARLTSDISPDAALYMIYTSGTTGRPKGVVVEQSAFLNLYAALEQQVYGRERPLQLALMASFSFDASMQQIAAVLLGGHTLNIVPEVIKTDPKALYQYLKRRCIDVCDGTPTLFSLLTDYCRDHEKTCSVATFILGGEPLKSDVLGRYFTMESHGCGRIINAYGPTECTVDATLFEITKENHDAYGTPPIGYALPNTRITVRGRNAELMPPGMPGELWIGGRGLARGYFNDPVLTASRFTVRDGERWYRTGDMGRYLKNGLLFFSGREDDQVKVGGFRVELGEVEAALIACPLVAKAVVRAGDFSGSGVNTLACYFTPRGGGDVSAIRSFLGKVLPKYAVPSHYVSMTAFPINSSGKIDVHSLPSPLGALKGGAGTAEQALSTPTRQKIARLWETLLGRPVTSASCDFFEMGGHSILGVRLIALMEKAFGRRLSLFDLYRASTIASQAELLDEKNDEDQGTYQPIVTFSGSGGETSVFLFHPVGGHALRYRFLADLLAGDFQVYGVQAPGVEQDTPWLLNVEDMAQLYLSRILEKIPQGPLIFVGWSFGGLVAFETACCLERKEERTARVVLLDTVADNRIARQTVAEDESAMLERLFRENLDVTREEIESHKGKERLDYLIDLGVENGILPSGFNRNHMRRLLQIYSGNALAAARYQPGRSRGGALLIRPSQAIESAMNISEDPLQGWDGQFEQGVVLKWMRGDHESMLTEQGAKVVWQHMMAYLKKG